MLALLLSLAACGGGSAPSTPAPKPAATAPAAATAPVAAATPVANVGPDGPESITIPAGFPKTTAELPTDEATLKKGADTFTAKGCGACHKFDSKLVGPALNGVGDRRTPGWIARMVLKPEVMIKDDPQAKKLFGEMMTPMANQGVPDAEILPLVAYLANHKGP